LRRAAIPVSSRLIAASLRRQPSSSQRWCRSRGAWRWQRLLDNGVYSSVSEIGDTENISMSCVSGILRLTLLAPDIVERIVEGRATAALLQVLKPFRFSGSGSATSLLSAAAEEKVCREGGHPAGWSPYIR
jgi:hypothetical protein